MSKKSAKTLLMWFQNTTIDPDTIMDYFKISKKNRKELRKIALEIRKEQYG